ncbi:LOW QUALITY PROTEIN: polygalacturonase-like [Cucumis melo]|uniref:LOW QUALITY PROTEIN: polygalacturonase-like n=1 Tax=Cucumis melo TaxID=3656 RepID=A0ABM3KG74_CUCME|nr:LOW QUALITY PROTEIN: polygalacturonase-like [Cucumis melo]
MALHKTLFILFLFLTLASASTFNVVDFGAKPNIGTDSSQAFEEAWASACRATTAVSIYVPKGRFYVKSIAFEGPCNNNDITIRIDGTLLAPSNYAVIANSGNWITFKRVDGVNVFGGVLDAQGFGLWACKNSKSSCPSGATSLEFSNSKNIMVSGLTSLNSQMFHIVINGCQNVKAQGLKISAAGNSPNTDGIHVALSSTVTILNSIIGTGDDCISIGPGTSNLWIENVACGPGHGISIGSLGREVQEDGVENVTVKSATFTNTQNGVRIKTWGKPSNGFARSVIFQDIVMVNVENPIIIDQNYCPDNKGCPGQDSGVKISDVTYENIHGTSATQVAMKFDCSSKFPCNDITLEDVELSYKNEAAEASCSHAEGSAAGLVQPSSCL